MGVSRHWCGSRLIDVVMVFVLATAVLKLADLTAFETALRSWSLLPKAAVVWLAVGVPALELAIGGLWLLRIHRALALALCGFMIAAFTVAYTAHLLLAEPPDCGCLGLLQQYQSQEAATLIFLVRNGILLMALGMGAWLTGMLPRFWPGRGKGRHIMRSRVSQPQGFTLIETIMVIALVGILVSLLLPALGGARRQAQRIDAIADLRSHMQVMTLYSIDYDDMWPYLTDPEVTYTIFRHPSGRAGPLLYFMVTNMWHWPLLGSYYPESGLDMFVAAGDLGYGNGPPSGVFSSYTYSATMYSRPEFWQLKTRTGPKQWRPVRVSDVRFPSNKGGLSFDEHELDRDADGAFVRIWHPIGFCDGSASNVKWNDITRPYPKGDGHWWGSFDGFGIRVRHTIGGVYGRDIE